MTRQKERPQVKLVGEDGNAFFILGRVQHAMKKAGWTEQEIREFIKEATAGDYDHLLRTVMTTCDCDKPEMGEA